MKKALFIIFTLIFSLSGCSTSQPQANTNSIQIAASFYPEAFLAEQIGGDFVSVYSIIPFGVEPHDFEPSPSDISHITNSKLFLYHGADLDLWASRIAAELDTNKIAVLKASDSVELKSGDPHFWLDPVLMRKIADSVLEKLISVDPVNRSSYEKNAEALHAKLSALNDDFINGLKDCRVRDVATSHNAFSYMARAYSFTPLSISGISPNVEPSVKDMQNLISILKTKNIHYVTFETLSSARISQTIADEVGAQSLVLNPIEGLTTAENNNGEDYISLMNKNLQTLRTAMECK